MTEERREYQETAVKETLKHLWADGKCLIAAPTGSGKTVIAGQLMRDHFKRVYFAAERRQLVEQAARAFWDQGLDVSVDMAEQHAAHGGHVVASQQTARNRFRSGQYDLIITDEAHIRHGSWSEIIERENKNGTPILGLTATPFREGMHEQFKNVVNCGTVNSLVSDGHLCPIKVFRCEEVDVAKMRIRAGDFVEEDMSIAAHKSTGDVIQTYEKLTKEHWGERRPAVFFVPSVDEAAYYAQSFGEAGHDFRVVSYRAQDKMVQEDNLDAFFAGKCHGLINCEMLTRGFDAPHLQYIGMVRPYTRLSPVVQIIGRLMRKFAGKDFGIAADHASNYSAHFQSIAWLFEHGVSQLQKAERVDKERKRDDSPEKKPPRCHKCGMIFAAGESYPCPNCGAGRITTFGGANPGELTEFAAPRPNGKGGTREHRGVTFGDVCTCIQTRVGNKIDNRKKLGMAKAVYKDITGKWPPWGQEFLPTWGDVPAATIAAFDDSQKRYRSKKDGKRNAA